MKKSFILNKNENGYILKDTNPNRKDEPFRIGVEELKFDTESFYDYVFKDVTMDYSIEIQNQLDEQDKIGIIIYKTIDEIAQGVLEKIKQIKN